MRDEFARCHPALNFLYYLLVIGVTMFYMHPVLTGISGAAVVAYLIYLRGWRGFARVCVLAFPVILLATVINPMFSHQGLTILGYLPTGNPITLESMVYGLFAGAMMGVVILWFSTFHAVMTRDKMVYLFGKGLPALALMLSMVLRFIPQFYTQMERVDVAQRCVGRDIRTGSWWERLKKGIHVLSIMVTWSLENSVDTADSMRTRGYGLRGRTMYHAYRWDGRCWFLAAGMCLCFCVVMVGIFTKNLHVLYYPVWRMNGESPIAWLCYVFYGILCCLPLILNVVEDLKWRYWMCKI